MSLEIDVPPGRWVVGVSGGADSVALLIALARARPAESLHVAHLDHQTRGDASTADAAFVAELARSLGIGCTIARLSEIAPETAAASEAAFRAARLKLFARLASEQGAVGVLLAHHADDRAETVLLRLLRGGEPAALGGLRREAMVNGIHLCRPLLDVRRTQIETFLREVDQPWREDATNASDVFARNRVRHFLTERPELFAPLLRLADAADSLSDWTRAASPTLPASFASEDLGDLSDPLARRAARRWLIDRGVPSDDAGGDAARALIDMCRDRATAGRRDFAGPVHVRREKGRITATTTRP